MRSWIALSLFVLAGGVYLFWPTTKLPEIATNLPVSDRKASSRIFQERVVQMFPVGSNVQELVTYLSSQGFRPLFSYDGWQRSRLSDGIACPSYWSVRWKVSADGLIDAVGADWDNACY